MSEFNVESGVSLFDGKPFVAVEFGQTREKMRPTKAREIALMLLSCAEAAEQDAAIAAFARGNFGSAEDGARMVAMVRDFRRRFEGIE